MDYSSTDIGETPSATTEGPKLQPRQVIELKSKVAALKKRQSKAFLAISHQHAKILASLVPDEIIYSIDDYSIREYECILVLGDVSGFTDLSEKYNKTGKGGPSKLTQILNSYIGSMVQEILTYNGDLLKFSGDAFLAMWKCTQEKSMQDLITDVLNCAIIIQKNYGRYETDVGVTLRVKLGISAGHGYFSIIGDEKLRHYVLLGDPVWDVKLAEHSCSAGEVILSPSAWNHVNVRDYEHEYHPDGKHVKIIGAGETWQQTVDMDEENEEVSTESAVVDQEDVFTISYSDRTPKPEAGPILMSLSGKSIDRIKKPKEFSVRPSVEEAAKNDMKELLRPFIIPVVMKGVDMDEPLDYLTEMRQVVIMFLNLVCEELEWKELIALVDKSYRIVCGLVASEKGCVNKVSFFDKDLMMLIIFGLRGYKHDLESQFALRCAADVRHACAKLTGIKTASVGVTTGMTYCGVVGHILRREYTVIGVPVNKAARLMTNYPGKVTCDREVFLYSKLEARHFALQEPKALKGLHSVGPIYEYREESLPQGLSTVNKFPLLGRNKELDLCKSMIRKVQSRIMSRALVQNALVIMGEPRQGKSRLLDEIMYSVQSEMTIHKIALNPRDQKVPYSTMQLIFSSSLGITETSLNKDKENKLKLKLIDTRYPEFLCCLNPVFNVNFELSQSFLTYNAKDRYKALRAIVVELFRKMGMCGIDDSEFIDDDTWRLFPLLLETNSAFFVLTMGTRRTMSKEVNEILKHKKIKVITLEGLDKWYHAGLACQILDVRAIPAELEKVIQIRSNGNPGWVESFLVSLIQAGGLLIRNIPKNEIVDFGLVSPPAHMMFRHGANFQEDGSEEEDIVEVNMRADGWKLYQFSYKESITSIITEKEKKIKSKLAPVCTVAPNFHMENVDTDVTVDVMMMKVFDSLTSFQQMLLKCSSVLGETFPRTMLISIMGSEDLREIALAVKKLFEIRVLRCGIGDFTQSDDFMVYRQRGLNPNTESELDCECIGIPIEEVCKDLPKYASCGLIRFRMPMFRETTYSLLTDNQKKDFHMRAVRFLEREAKRCVSCGGGPFTQLFGQRYDQNVRRFEHRNKKLELDIPVEEPNIAQVDQQMPVELGSEDRGDLTPQRSFILQMTSDESSVPLATDSRTTCNFFRPRWNTRVHSAISITQSFSNIDFTNCQCNLILATMYTQLLEHCRGSGRFDKLIEVLMEFAAVSIAACNQPHAVKLLDDAALLIEQGKITDDDIPSWKVPYISGRIHALRGYSRLESGHVQDAAGELYASMKDYGYRYPHYSVPARFSTFFERLKLKCVLQIAPKWGIGRTKGYNGQIADQISECLGLMCTLFMMTQHWRLAELAAVWGLNKALASDQDFFGMCKSYSNLMEVAQHYGNEYVSWQLEQFALDMCNRKTCNIEKQDLEAIAHLYFAIFNSRIVRAELKHGVTMGFKTIRICASIHAIRLKLQLLPLLIYVLMMRQQLPECVSLLTELDYAATEDTDKSGRTWYFALSVVFQLETGYCFIPFKKCEQFFQEEGESMITLRDPEAQKRYFISMWLWCIRNEDWEAATVWAPHTDVPSTLLDEESVNNIITAQYLLEGLLLYMVGKVDVRNIRAISRTYMEIGHLIKRLSKACKVNKLALPRFQILKAYYRQIRYHDPKAMKQLMFAKSIAQKQGNLLDLQWSEHTEKVWTGTISAIQRDFWRDHSQPDDLVDYHECVGGNLRMFSLPIPKYAI